MQTPTLRNQIIKLLQDTNTNSAKLLQDPNTSKIASERVEFEIMEVLAPYFQKVLNSDLFYKNNIEELWKGTIESISYTTEPYKEIKKIDNQAINHSIYYLKHRLIKSLLDDAFCIGIINKKNNLATNTKLVENFINDANKVYEQRLKDNLATKEKFPNYNEAIKQDIDLYLKHKDLLCNQSNYLVMEPNANEDTSELSREIDIVFKDFINYTKVVEEKIKNTNKKKFAQVVSGILKDIITGEFEVKQKANYYTEDYIPAEYMQKAIALYKITSGTNLTSPVFYTMRNELSMRAAIVAQMLQKIEMCEVKDFRPRKMALSLIFLKSNKSAKIIEIAKKLDSTEVIDDVIDEYQLRNIPFCISFEELNSYYSAFNKILQGEDYLFFIRIFQVINPMTANEFKESIEGLLNSSLFKYKLQNIKTKEDKKEILEIVKYYINNKDKFNTIQETYLENIKNNEELLIAIETEKRQKLTEELMKECEPEKQVKNKKSKKKAVSEPEKQQNAITVVEKYLNRTLNQQTDTELLQQATKPLSLKEKLKQTLNSIQDGFTFIGDKNKSTLPEIFHNSFKIAINKKNKTIYVLDMKNITLSGNKVKQNEDINLKSIQNATKKLSKTINSYSVGKSGVKEWSENQHILKQAGTGVGYRIPLTKIGELDGYKVFFGNDVISANAAHGIKSNGASASQSKYKAHDDIDFNEVMESVERQQNHSMDIGSLSMQNEVKNALTENSKSQNTAKEAKHKQGSSVFLS